MQLWVPRWIQRGSEMTKWLAALPGEAKVISVSLLRVGPRVAFGHPHTQANCAACRPCCPAQPVHIS
jgi:hypothetical protein